jgi:hypothetical protein
MCPSIPASFPFPPFSHWNCCCTLVAAERRSSSCGTVAVLHLPPCRHIRPHPLQHHRLECRDRPTCRVLSAHARDGSRRCRVLENPSVASPAAVVCGVTVCSTKRSTCCSCFGWRCWQLRDAHGCGNRALDIAMCGAHGVYTPLLAPVTTLPLAWTLCTLSLPLAWTLCTLSLKVSSDARSACPRLSHHQPGVVVVLVVVVLRAGYPKLHSHCETREAGKGRVSTLYVCAETSS